MALLDLVDDNQNAPARPRAQTVFDAIRESPEQEQSAAEKIRKRYAQPAQPPKPVTLPSTGGGVLEKLARSIPQRSSSPFTMPAPTLKGDPLFGARYDIGIDKPAPSVESSQEEPHTFQGDLNSTVGNALMGANPAGGILMKLASLNPVTAGIARGAVSGANALALGIPSAIAPQTYSALQQQLSTGSKAGDVAADISGNLAGSIGGLQALSKLGLSNAAGFVAQGVPAQVSNVVRNGPSAIPQAALSLGVDYATGRAFEAAKPLAEELLPENASKFAQTAVGAATQAPVGAMQSILSSAAQGRNVDYTDVLTNAAIAGGFGALDVGDTRKARRDAAVQYAQGDLGDRVIQAIGMYEQRTSDPSELASSRALKSDSGQAAGFAQLTPDNIATYSEQVLGKRLTKNQFKQLSYPDQYRVTRAMSDGILSKNIQRYGDIDKAIDATAIEWFGGPAGRRKWERGKEARVTDGHDTGDKYIAGVREKLGLLDSGQADQNAQSVEPTQEQPQEEQPEQKVQPQEASPPQENLTSPPAVEEPEQQAEPSVPLPEPPISENAEEGRPAFVSPEENERSILQTDSSIGGPEPAGLEAQRQIVPQGIYDDGQNREYQTGQPIPRGEDIQSNSGGEGLRQGEAADAQGASAEEPLGTESAGPNQVDERFAHQLGDQVHAISTDPTDFVFPEGAVKHTGAVTETARVGGENFYKLAGSDEWHPESSIQQVTESSPRGSAKPLSDEEIINSNAPATAREATLLYLANGGKLHIDDVKRDVIGSNAKIGGENADYPLSYRKMFNKNGKPINQFVHEDLPQLLGSSDYHYGLSADAQSNLESDWTNQVHDVVREVQSTKQARELLASKYREFDDLASSGGVAHFDRSEVEQQTGLSPDSRIAQDAQLFENTESRDAKTLAEWSNWIDSAVKANPDLTLSHQNELYDFLRSNYGKNGAQSKDDFLSTVNDAANRKTMFGVFEGDTPLNLGGASSKSPQVIEYEGRIQDAQKALKRSQNELANKQQELVGKGANAKDQARILKQYRDNVTIATQDLIDLKTKSPDVISSIKNSEIGLFSSEPSSRLSPPGSLQSVVIPGAESALEVYQKDIAPTLRNAALAVREASEDIHKTLSPSSRGAEAEQTKLIMRNRLAELARQSDTAEAALSDAREALDPLPQQDKYDFIDKVERGTPQVSPELNEISKNLRRLLEERKDAIQELGTGKLQSVIENYFPHLWENPEQAQSAFAQAYSKRPFEGSKSFLKQRSIGYFKEGIELGLKPVTDNPVDLTLLKLREMDRYLMAHNVMNEMKEQGLLKFFPATERIPDGYTKIDDKVGTVYGAPESKIPLKTISAIAEQVGVSQVNPKEVREGLGEQASVSSGGFPIVGYYAAPEPAARLINNYLSPGLREKSGLFRAYLSTANTLNQFQLGYSAFHLGFTSMDAVTSQFASGIYKAAHGDLAKGAGTAATALFAPIKNFKEGSKVLSEWLKPGSQGEEYAHIVDALQKGGGRAKMDNFYRTTAVENVKKVWAETDHLIAKVFRTGIRLPFAATELAAKPIMEFLVPRMKLGAFFQMAEYELARSQPALDAMEPAARTAEIRRLMSNAWDSVDNRMGQLVYDNLFWDKTTKDLAMASVRSVGWNLGTFRELGGGLIDYGRAIKSLAKREQVEFTHRMAYVAALPIVAGTAGAVFQYLMTGKGPDQLKDYFFPKDGGTDEHGNATRVSLPTYMKDIYAYYKDMRDAATIGGNPARTLLAKTHPLIATISEMLQNKDFYGTKIRNEDDPFVQQALDELGHLATTVAPFGVRGIARNIELNGLSAKTFLPEIGITPAPSDLNKSEAQKLMSKYIEESMPQGSRTKEAADRSNARRQVTRTLRMGDRTDALSQFKALVKEGKLAPEDSKLIQREANSSPLQVGFKHLDVDKAIKVYEVATPEERKELRPLLAHKWQGRKPSSMPPEQYRELQRRVQQAARLTVAK